jgi:hypothetical protein
MDEPISARYVWGAEAMTEGLAVHQRQSLRPFLRYLGIGVGLFVVFLSLLIPIWMIVDSRVRSMPEFRRNAAIALVVLVVIWGWLIEGIWNHRFLRWNARRAFRSNPNAAGLVEWSFGPDQISNRTALSSSTIVWPVFVKVVEAPQGISLYQSMQFFHWIPAHAFASGQELRRFADLARDKVPHYVVLGECQFPAKPEPIGLQEL